MPQGAPQFEMANMHEGVKDSLTILPRHCGSFVLCIIYHVCISTSQVEMSL